MSKTIKATLDIINHDRRMLRQRLRQAIDTNDTPTIERRGFACVNGTVISVIILHLVKPQPAASA